MTMQCCENLRGPLKWGLVCLWFVGAGAAVACDDGDKGAGDASDGDGGTREPLPEEFSTFEVVWQDGVVVQDDLTAVQDALVSMDFDTGVLVLDAGYPGLDDLYVGTTAVIAGVGVFRITAREIVADGEALTLEAVPLTDVIQDGVIGWRRNFAGLDTGSALGLGMEEAPADSIRQIKSALSGSYKDGALSASGKVGDFDTKFTLKNSGADMEMTMSAKFTGAGNTIANVAAKGSLRGFSNETTITIEGGSVTDFTLLVDHINGEVHVDAGGVELGSGSVPVKIPARISIPVVLGGIPFHVDIGGSLELSTTLEANCSAIMKGYTTFSGSMGIQVKGGSVATIGKLDSPGLHFETADHVGTITAGLGILLNFPEATVGVGLAGLASAEAYLKFSTEVISNMEIFYDAAGPVPVITGNCVTSRVNFGAFYGGRAEFLGFTLAESETPLFGEIGEAKKSGDKCE
jgi:hypothetical protein